MSIEKLRFEFDGDASKFQSAINKSQKSVNNFSANLKQVGGIIAGAFAIDKISEFGSSVIETTATFQRFESVLTNTLGSQSQAQKALDRITDFASKTPFSVEELTDSFVRLANQGFRPTSEEMRKLGDLASSTGKDFVQLTYW
jgi:phage tail tape-measure protein